MKHLSAQKGLAFQFALAMVCLGLIRCASSSPESVQSLENGSGKGARVEHQLEDETSIASSEADSSIHGEEIRYQADGVMLTGYLAYDAQQKGPRPGVLVVHEWWGHNDYVRRRARMLAELGYTAFALDMYGDGKNTTHPDTAKQFMMQVLKDMPGAEARFKAAFDLLKQHKTTNPEKIAAIGYCFGGGVVLHMARAGLDLDGVAVFHGSLATETPAKPGKVKAKVLVINGGADPFVPQEQVMAFEKEMKKAKVDYELILLPGVKHAFTNPGATELGKKHELPLEYDAQADHKSWETLKEFLEQAL